MIFLKILYKIGIIIVIAITGILTSCNGISEYSEEFFAMDTIMSVKAYGNSSEEACKAVEKEINSLDSLLSVENKNSEIYKLNKAKAIVPSSDTLEIITRSKEISDITNGAFDITTEPLTEAWGFYTESENRIPTKKEINRILKSVGTEHFSISKNKITLDKDTSVDTGGIAKGYASAKAVKILKKYNISSGLISLGGNVRAVGYKPDGSDWIVGIADPDDTNEQIGTLAVHNTAVVTSGSYQRYFEKNGKIYHHIIDPQTGYPAESSLKSVTVISQDDTLADGLSTALFVMGLDKGTEFYRESSESFGAVFVTDSREVYVTDNIKDCYSSENSFKVIKK
jgi:thiamine biosynthesis lipoprotein